MPTLAQKILQAKHKKKNKETFIFDDSDVKKINESKDHIEVSTLVATKMWNDIKKRVTEDPKFVGLPDTEKVAIYQNSEFKEFYTEFPIVSRYMVCMGQFSSKALKKYLLKCKNVQHDPVKSREKGYTEDQWVQRQADYVRYLWESYQRQHYSPSESTNIWNHAYKTLKQEFKDFRNMHEEIENKLKDSDKSNKGEMVKELLKRLTTQEQTFNNEDTTNTLVDKLKEQVLEQRKKNLIKSINEDIEQIPPTRETRGSRKVLKSSNKTN
jgi:hypothetical protein